MYIMVLLLEALYCVSNVRMISHQTQKCLLRKLSIRWIVFILNSSRKTLNTTTRNKKKNKQKEKPWFSVIVHFNAIRTILREPIFILFE